MKPLHRLIVTSRAYRMSSKGAGRANRDRRPGQRLPLALPDAAAGSRGRPRQRCCRRRANSTRRRAARRSPQEQGLTVAPPQPVLRPPRRERGWQFLDLFDAANPCDAYRRTASVLPQQALALTNSELALRLSRALAGEAVATAAGSDEAFVTAAFEQVLGRPPRDAELTASRGVPDAAGGAVRGEHGRAEGRAATAPVAPTRRSRRGRTSSTRCSTTPTSSPSDER